MSNKRISKPGEGGGASRNTDDARGRTPQDDKLDDMFSGMLDNDLDAQVNEGNQRAARGLHTEEKPLSKRAAKRGSGLRH